MPQSQSVYALLSLIQALLNMSTLSMNDQGKSFWELVYGSVNQVLADHRRWHPLRHRTFPVTLQRTIQLILLWKKFRLFFCCNFSTLQQQESPAIADEPARRESLPKIALIRRAYNVVADDTGLSSFV